MNSIVSILRYCLLLPNSFYKSELPSLQNNLHSISRMLRST
jgi:hypothetical protein